MIDSRGSFPPPFWPERRLLSLLLPTEHFTNSGPQKPSIYMFYAAQKLWINFEALKLQNIRRGEAFFFLFMTGWLAGAWVNCPLPVYGIMNMEWWEERFLACLQPVIQARQSVCLNKSIQFRFRFGRELKASWSCSTVSSWGENYPLKKREWYWTDRKERVSRGSQS